MMGRMHFVVNLHHQQHSVKSVVYALLLSFSLSSNSNNAAVVRSTATMTTQAQPQPPVAKKVPHKMELFGDVRVDNYYWLRDDSRSNPDMLSYLQQENAFTDSLMSDSKKFEDELYAEIRGRIKEDDVSAPVRRGAYYYYQRTLEGKEYVQHCRRPVPNPNAPPSVHDTMPTDPNAEEEHIILDENVKAQSYDYYSIAAFKVHSLSLYLTTIPINLLLKLQSFLHYTTLQVSPNNKLVAYAEDTKGDEIYTVYVIDAETGATVDKPLVGVTAYLEWASDASLVYITMDDILRPHKVGSSLSFFFFFFFFYH